MRRIPVRLVLSHAAVAVVAALTTFLVVRWLAPGLFDASLQRYQATIVHGPGSTGGGGLGLRADFARAVDQSLLAGAAMGVVVAAGLGAIVAIRLGRSLRRMGEATRRMAAGDYDVRVRRPVETELATLSDDINTLGATLAETESRRTRLLGEVAHEMRTPLTVIDGYVEGMIDGVLSTDAARLARLEVETRRLRRLSDDLSELSRVEENRLAVQLVRTDLRTVASDVAERLRTQAEDAGLVLTVRLGADALPVDADADRLAQVVTNLVGNAIRATPPGGHVTVSCRAEEGRTLLVVEDSGEGIAADDLERVFERFYRVPGRRTPGAESGSGIGLTIARAIARLHGGELTASSAGPGRGATFTLALPTPRP